ncbi:AbrB family transcriptional regulator [Usitatibacter palustris]|uniref:Ammonia monooxygenase n=1 Tax=Usitatibacter palustris TaxID=2732487 RepID=A0A6M4HA47_9PROT|nr:AbrB family transcriptional regulator [Usitatibacter palustris]QJR16659.1 hypothetical protein DSM104440_03495 [Usitatibacter palustris]
MTKDRRGLAIAAGLAVCLAGGSLCAWLGTPLPWMIGPLVAMAICQFSGARLESLPFAREGGQLVIGVALGLYFTPPVVREISTYGLYFIALGFAAIGAGAVSGRVLARLSGVDGTTAYFSCMPGGAGEMAVMGEMRGAKVDRIALAHSLRMLIVVLAIPVAMTLAGFSGVDDYQPIARTFEPGGFAVLIAVALAVALLAQRLKIRNAFMIGPLFAAIALTIAGVTLSSVPPLASNAAQLVLAGVMGTQFQQRFLREAPRFMGAVLVSIAVLIALSAGVGALIAWTSGAYLGSSLLAAAPGGIVEMAITAKVLKIGVPFVTAAHVCRYVIVVSLCDPIYRWVTERRSSADKRG